MEPSCSTSRQIKVETQDDEEVAENDRRPNKFQVNMGLIPSAELTDDAQQLRELGLNVFNQEDFEQGVLEQVDKAISKDEEDKKKGALKAEIKKINDEMKGMKHELASLATQLAQLGHGKAFSTGGANRRLVTVQKQKEAKVLQMKTLEEKKKNIQARLDGKLPLFDEKEIALRNMLKSSGNEAKDTMIRTGEMTPFGTVQVKEERVDTSSSAVPSIKQENLFDKKDKRRYPYHTEGASHFPGQDADFSDHSEHSDGEVWEPKAHDRDTDTDSGDLVPEEKKIKKEKVNSSRKKKKNWSKAHNRPIYRSGSEDSDADTKERLPRTKAIRKHLDDGLESYYDARMRQFHNEERRKQRLREAGQLDESDDDEEFDGGLKVPSRIWSKLFKYQKTCVKWLWELHCQEAGGIVGDEMGLGKTIQAIAFLSAIKYSRLPNKDFNYPGLGPCLVVCPATVMHQWVKEFHTWWPPFRVGILHASGAHTGKERDLIRHMAKNSGVLVTSYTTLVLQQDELLLYNWHYVVLDEGHKIRNPDTKATLACKQFRTSHRLILSGSPIQNNLKELWSLMDFVFPGKLGTLPDFMQHFAVPIVQGGYSNATDVQVQTAYRCACVLRDTINPYLLRRMKADVKMNINLPGKSEQVLFCRLTEDQREVYTEYLASRECQEIMNGRFMVFAGLIQLRKICNHPDLATGGPRVFHGDNTDNDPSLEYGFWKRAGKMIVVDALLKLWKKQGHRALLFTQSTQMLDILESYVQAKGYTYVRMDGGTGISSRQPLVQRYNTDSNIYLFLLTTRVGGLGINLIGANRIIIYDPDWNPSTDMQARERAWRIGQNRQVTIYRLLCTGTIEEKIYHRQIFKQFLTNRVLKDPKQRRLFKTNDMYELFSLGLSDDKGETETAALFAGTGTDVTVKPTKVNRFDRLKAKKVREKEKEEEQEERLASDNDVKANFDTDEIQRMREIAKRLSQKIGKDKDAKVVTDNHGKSQGTNSCNSASTSTSISTSSSGHRTTEKKTVVCSREKSPIPGTLKNYKIKKKPASEIKSETPESSSSNSPTPEVAQSRSRTDAHKSKQKNDGHSKDGHKRKSLDTESDRKHKHKKKKHKKDAKFEGERIPNLSKVRDFKGPNAEDIEAEKEESEQMDNYVLQRLFKKTGIQGALRHDKIMEPGQADYVIVENEAEKVAKEAAQALKRSRSQCLPARAGVPTWTGQHGGKRPRFGQKKNTILGKGDNKEKTQSQSKEEKHFDGSLAGSVQTDIETGANVSSAVSSTDLLNKMRVRNQVFSKPGDAANNGEENDDEVGFLSDPSSLDLLKRIREFVMFECSKFGAASTQEILDEFGKKLPPENSAKFRAMLRSICDFQKVDGLGTWKLRQDFR